MAKATTIPPATGTINPPILSSAFETKPPTTGDFDAALDVVLGGHAANRSLTDPGRTGAVLDHGIAFLDVNRQLRERGLGTKDVLALGSTVVSLIQRYGPLQLDKVVDDITSEIDKKPAADPPA